MFTTLIQIFSQVRYTVIAVITSAVVFTFAVWLPNFRLIIEILFNSSASSVEKTNIILSLFKSIQTNFSVVSASYTIAIAVLFGINTALIIYYIRSRQNSKLGSGTTLSAGGLVSGIFGIGCASCGTFVIGSLLSIFGASVLLTYLPFGGEEFGFLGVALLIYSSYLILKKINEPLVCNE